MNGDGAETLASTHAPLFPYLRQRGEIALIGCSSALATPPFSASGYFSSRQARALASLLHETGERGLCRIVMIHHPPIRGATTMHKRLIGIRRFQAALRMSGAELVLHGHTHLNTVYHLEAKGKHIPVVGISSASQGPGGKKPVAGFNLFSITGEAGKWQIMRERFALNPVSEKMDLAEKNVF
jgi:3',5'-cyclic AMP phosphodiesterase CpdA